MIQQYSYLIFRINNSLYGVNTLSVKEIFLLPELTSIPDPPLGIVGVIDIRGHILPVMDLNFRFGRQGISSEMMNNYSLTDQVIVVEQGEQDLGIIVDEVYEVRNISETNISETNMVEEVQSKRASSDIKTQQLITGVVKSSNDILVILNLANLLQYVSEPDYRQRSTYLSHYPSQQEPLELLPDNHRQNAKLTDDHNRQLMLKGETGTALTRLSSSQTKLTPEALAILRKRANRLRQIDEIRENSQNFRKLAVFILNQEFFSVDLANVKEFTSIKQVVPVPCCPPHIVGNMNLRGEILTVVDICHLLNLSPVNLSKVAQLMVVEVEDLRVGLIIERVHDTITIDVEEIDLAPAASYSTNKDYFQGTLSYQKNMVSILDIVKILQNGNLIVDLAR
jgi:purine-binding chemotaxis protein CheW